MDFSKLRSKPFSWWLQTPLYAARVLARDRSESAAMPRSYSQCGEDLITRFLFESLGIKTPNYLDIGAYDPAKFSNTMLFYKCGSKGVCVEPNPQRARRFARRRRQDLVLNAGIGDGTQKEAPFYVMSIPTLSSFDLESCQAVEASGQANIIETLQLPLLDINHIAQKYFSNKIDFLSLDVEGWDERILSSIDFDQVRPKVICVETMDFLSLRKRPFAAHLLEANGYSNYADTHINTIFFDTSK